MPLIIVGGGFSGLVNSYFAEESILYEEHRSVGYPSHCTGLVSTRFVSALGSVSRENIVNKYRSITVNDLGGKELITLRTEAIYRLDREKLERDLLKESLDKGSKISLRTRILDIEELDRETICLAIHKLDENIVTRNCFSEEGIILLADGVLGNLSRRYIQRNKRDLLLGAQVVIESSRSYFDTENIHVFVSDKLFPRFFGWLVPISEKKAIIGGGFELDSRINIMLKYFLHNLKKIGFIGDFSIKRFFGGLITRSLATQHVFERIVVGGDAAGLTKAFTGGGLYPSLYQAIAVRDAISRSSDASDFSRVYNRSMKIFVKELLLQKIFTEYVSRIGVERFVRILSSRISSIYIDYDYHIGLLRLFLRVIG